MMYYINVKATCLGACLQQVAIKTTSLMNNYFKTPN